MDVLTSFDVIAVTCRRFFLGLFHFPPCFDFFALFRCDLSFFALLIFTMALFGLFRFDLVSVQDPKHCFTKQAEHNRNSLVFRLVSVRDEAKKVFRRTQ